LHKAKLLVLLWLDGRYPDHATAIRSADRLDKATVLSITHAPEAKSHAALLLAQAVLFHIAGHYEEVANCFEAIVHKMPGNPVLLEFYGRSLHKIGALVKSLGAYRCALRFDPESCPARYGIACLYWDMGFRELSIRWLVDAMKLQGNGFHRSDDQIRQTLSECLKMMVSSHV
jgi:tetratricopeptide (TPR) repeat protein